MRVSASLAAAFFAAAIAVGASTIVQAGSPVSAFGGGGELFAKEEDCGGRNNPCKPVCTDESDGKDCKRMGSER